MFARSIARSMLAVVMLSGAAWGAPVLEQPLVAERASAAWTEELERRLVSLAFPSLQTPGSVEPHTSPRYASHEIPGLEGTLFGCSWSFEPPSAEERALLEIAVALLAGRSGSVLSRQLVDRGLATEVAARLTDHGERTLLSVFVFGTRLGQQMDMGDTMDAAVSALSVSGPTESELEQVIGARRLGDHSGVSRDAVRRVVTRYLDPQRRSVVELVPRNAPDPALSVKPREESTRRAMACRKPTGRPTAVAGERAVSACKEPPSRKIVEAGDTLIAIARRYKVTVRELASQNKIDPARPIRVGQTLVVPNRASRSSDTRVRRGTVAKSQKPTPARLRDRPKPRGS